MNYELKTYKRAPVLAPPEYKALHPSGAAPVIQDGDLTLAESCACIEYICHKYAGGKLFLPPTHPAYADFLYWWHWPNGSLQPTVSRLMAVRSLGLGGGNIMATFANDRLRRALVALEERLGDNEWLAGSEFTVADVMVVFSLTTMRCFSPYNLGEYGNVLRYLRRVSEREAYRTAMKKSDPEMEPVLGADPPRSVSI